MSPGRPPRVPRVPRERPQPSASTIPRIRSDESIGRQEDIGSLVQPKPKTTRITVDLSPDDYAALKRCTSKADAEMEGPRVTFARELRAMIHATDRHALVADVVEGLLHRDTGAI